ncbi:single-stranded-DNA-specific exonuclease RecJ [Candidatus Aerophobetes bacterium]|nr:single-stranded-DNA-specific exonuclease RecJ [Candidatus Aerophobetes bacterium]
MRKKWNEERCHALSLKWKLSPLLIKLLLNREVEEECFSSYFSPSFDNLHEPFCMKGMEEAVGRILLSILRKEKVLIWGDFDVDGVTATTLLLKFMHDLKSPAYYYIPHRESEGYGLNKDGIRKAFTKNIKLIITCDCGTSSVDEIKLARSLGMEVVVTDHHQVEEPPPADFILINPHNSGCTYPFKELSGVGVAFKLCQAIAQRTNFPREKLKSYLDLVAIGTLADVVPLTGENRTFVKLGMDNLPSSTTSSGLRALIKVAGLSGRAIEEKEIGYILSPRLNACGRLSLAKTAVKLLSTDSMKEALLLAHKLNRENSRRQSLEKKMCQEAEKIISKKLKYVLIVYNKDWHPGVVGLVASYLREKYNRPALAFSIDEDIARGSARSISRFSVFEALEKCSYLITSFGGHKMAAGLTLPLANLEKLEEKLNSIAEDLLCPEDFVPCKFFDAELNLSSLNKELVEELKILSPFGPGNPKPVFLAREVKVASWQNINKGKKFIITDSTGEKEFEALSFNFFNEEEEKSIFSQKPVDILYFPRLNIWRQKQTIQLDIKDIKEV